MSCHGTYPEMSTNVIDSDVTFAFFIKQIETVSGSFNFFAGQVESDFRDRLSTGWNIWILSDATSSYLLVPFRGRWIDELFLTDVLTLLLSNEVQRP